MNTYFSIIIPVYNTADYLRECLDSVLNQTYGNYEAILIDDGSTDESTEICQEYCKRDKRLRMFRQANGGASSAKNKGLETAQGDIIAFLDSDDMLAPFFLEHLARVFEKGYNLVCFQGRKFKKTYQYGRGNLCFEEYTSEQIIRDFLYRHKKLTITCSSFRREHYSQLNFEEKLYVGEDIVMLTEILVREKSVPFISSEIYAYRIRKSSVSHSGNWKRKLSGLKAIELVADTLKENGFFMEKALINRQMNSARFIYSTIPWKEKAERDKVWELIKKYRRTVITDGKSRKRERIAALVSLCGQGIYTLFLRFV